MGFHPYIAIVGPDSANKIPLRLYLRKRPV